jgi:hypothetical protein
MNFLAKSTIDEAINVETQQQKERVLVVRQAELRRLRANIEALRANGWRANLAE